MLAEAFKQAGVEATVTPATDTKVTDGYVFDTVRNGRRGRVTLGADYAAAEGKLAAVADIEADLKQTFNTLRLDSVRVR